MEATPKNVVKGWKDQSPDQPQKIRIPEEKWDELKPFIFQKYIVDGATLAKVKVQMEREHGFFATRRQYIHQFLTKWEIKKYKKGRKGNGVKSKDKTPESADDGDSEGNSSHNLDGASSAGGHPAPSQNHVALQQLFAGSSAQIFGLPSEQSYTQPHSSLPGNLIMDPEYDERRLRLQAEMFLAAGDPGAFPSYKRLCHGIPRDQSLDNQSLTDLIACVRAALTANHINEAREIIQENVDNVPGAFDDEKSLKSLATLVDLQAARTYDWESDERNAANQIEQRVLAITDDDHGPVKLKMLSPRGPSLDIPLLVYLSYAVNRWNELTTDAGDGAQLIDTGDLLQQFVHHQLTFPFSPETAGDASRKITSLYSCLGWCRDVLANNPSVPAPLLSSVTGFHVDALTATYLVVGTLWSAWLAPLPPPRAPSASHSTHSQLSDLTWPKNADMELGISATELLVTVVCMFMAEGTARSHPNNDVMSQARLGISTLEKTNDVFQRFLRQVLRNNDERMLAPRKHIDRQVPAVYTPFREFVCQFLGLQLPEVNMDSPIYPLVLATGDSRPPSYYASPQYQQFPIPIKLRSSTSSTSNNNNPAVPPLQPQAHSDRFLRSQYASPGSGNGRGL